MTTNLTRSAETHSQVALTDYQASSANSWLDDFGVFLAWACLIVMVRFGDSLTAILVQQSSKLALDVYQVQAIESLSTVLGLLGVLVAVPLSVARVSAWRTRAKIGSPAHVQAIQEQDHSAHSSAPI